jgi:hypothetical protein
MARRASLSKFHEGSLLGEPVRAILCHHVTAVKNLNPKPESDVYWRRLQLFPRALRLPKADKTSMSSRWTPYVTQE